MAIRIDYFRAGRWLSWPAGRVLLMGPTALAAAALLAVLPVCAQYPGQVAKNAKASPELRAIAVLEWTGDPGSPKASRLVPVAVLDAGQLQDGGIYLARPEPLSLAGEVEYELQQNGKPIGLYDVKNTGQEQGSWVGYGAWKPLPAPAREKHTMSEMERAAMEDDSRSDQPVLHRKHHAGDKPADEGGGGSGAGSSAPAADADPDRPTLHKKSAANTASDADASVPADPDQPTLHKKTTEETAAGAEAPDTDPDRPTLHKSKKKVEDVGHVKSIADSEDPDRPRLKRGKSAADALNVIPTLMGMPPEMEQAVAVSDRKTRTEHPWIYAWANPQDEARMKSALEEMARDALGIKRPAPPPAPASRKTATRKTARPATPPPPPEPLPLMDEQFRVFELAYGSGATLVLTAHTDGPFAQQKFVTLVAQPDLYGNVLPLLKNVTDGRHLDETPRMRLVDAVDALADNRGELLFELRGDTQRQFALYRVLRGQAEKLFVTGAGEFGSERRE